MRENSRKPDMRAFVATETGGKSFYTEIGAAWKNKAGGYSVRLTALPVGGEVLLFPPKDKPQE